MPTKDASAWGSSIDSFELPDMTDGAKNLIAKNKISDEKVLEIETSGTNGKLQKADVEAYLSAGVTPDTKTKSEYPLSMTFEASGWCEKLGKSYFRGVYKPTSKEEYEALKPFAK